MALIPDLPAASGLSDTDLFVIDTGSQTKKIPASDVFNFIVAQTIATFSGTSSATISLAAPIANFKFVVLRLFDTNGVCVSSMTLPRNFAAGNTYKLFGESSSQWGSVEFPANVSAGTAICNRTSANTSSIVIVGVK